MSDLSLTARPGLPDALRVLAEAYPRDMWAAHPNFTKLTRFWLDRHLMFRDVLGRLVDVGQALHAQDISPDAFGRDIARLGGFFLQELHAHHHVEDEHYFPLLTGEDPRLAAAFDLLDADHGVLDGRIHGLADRINRALGLLGDAGLLRGEAGPLIDDLEAMRALLDRHLTDEEEIVVPIILEHAPKALSG